MHIRVTFIHEVVSILFVITILLIIFRSTRAIIQKRSYTKFDRVLSAVFMAFMYLQFVGGIFLFVKSTGGYYKEAATNIEMADLRFWSIEHVFLMIFALFISHIGYITIYKSTEAGTKHKKSLQFFVIAFVLILISLSIVY